MVLQIFRKFVQLFSTCLVTLLRWIEIFIGNLFMPIRFEPDKDLMIDFGGKSVNVFRHANYVKLKSHLKKSLPQKTRKSSSKKFTLPCTKDLVSAADRAYSRSGKPSKGLPSVISSSWVLLLSGNNIKNQYNGICLVRRSCRSEKLQVIIAHKGSQGLSDYLEDLNGILNNNYCGQMNSACTFALLVTGSLNSLNIPFQIYITGHSLGGWLGQISCFAIKYLKLDLLHNPTELTDMRKCVYVEDKVGIHAHCEVFDSPGARNILQKIVNDLKLESSTSQHSFYTRLDITNYFRTPNRINTVNEHVGNQYIIQKKGDKTDFYNSVHNLPLWILYIIKSHEISTFVTELNSETEYEIAVVEKNWPLILHNNWGTTTSLKQGLVYHILYWFIKGIRIIFCMGLEVCYSIRGFLSGMLAEELALKKVIITQLDLSIVNLSRLNDSELEFICNLLKGAESLNGNIQAFNDRFLGSILEQIKCLKHNQMILTSDISFKKICTLLSSKKGIEYLGNTNLNLKPNFEQAQLFYIQTELETDLKKRYIAYTNGPNDSISKHFYEGSDLYFNRKYSNDLLKLEILNNLKYIEKKSKRPEKITLFVNEIDFERFQKSIHNINHVQLIVVDQLDVNSPIEEFDSHRNKTCTVVRLKRSGSEHVDTEIELNFDVKSVQHQYLQFQKRGTTKFKDVFPNISKFEVNRFFKLHPDIFVQLLKRSNSFSTVDKEILSILPHPLQYEYDFINHIDLEMDSYKEHVLELKDLNSQAGQANTTIVVCGDHESINSMPNLKKVNNEELFLEFRSICKRYPKFNVNAYEIRSTKMCIWRYHYSPKLHIERRFRVHRTDLKATQTDFLARNINPSFSESCDEITLFTRYPDYRFIVLADISGIGKSTSIAKMCMKYVEEYPNNLILHIDLSKLTMPCNPAITLNKHMPLSEIVKFFVHACGIKQHDHFGKFAIEWFLINNSHRIFIFFDGLNEIDESNKEYTIGILRELLGPNYLVRILISIRDYGQNGDLLSEKLDSPKVLYAEFDELTNWQCTEFVANFWTVLNIEKKLQHSHLNAIASHIRSECIGTDMKSFYTVPLHLRMYAEVCLEEIRCLNLSDSEPEAKLNLPELFQRFLKRKYKIYFIKKIACRNSEEVLQRCAPIQIHDEKQLQILACKNLKFFQLLDFFNINSYNVHFNELCDTGVIHRLCFKPGQVPIGPYTETFVFQHRKVTEFFLAKFIVDKVLNTLTQMPNLRKEWQNEFWTKLLENVFSISDLTFVRICLNGFVRNNISLKDYIHKSHEHRKYFIETTELKIRVKDSVEHAIKERLPEYLDFLLHSMVLDHQLIIETVTRLFPADTYGVNAFLIVEDEVQTEMMMKTIAHYIRDTVDMCKECHCNSLFLDKILSSAFSLKNTLVLNTLINKNKLHIKYYFLAKWLKTEEEKPYPFLRLKPGDKVDPWVSTIKDQKMLKQDQAVLVELLNSKFWLDNHHTSRYYPSPNQELA